MSWCFLTQSVCSRPSRKNIKSRLSSDIHQVEREQLWARKKRVYWLMKKAPFYPASRFWWGGPRSGSCWHRPQSRRWYWRLLSRSWGWKPNMTRDMCYYSRSSIPGYSWERCTRNTSPPCPACKPFLGQTLSRSCRQPGNTGCQGVTESKCKTVKI